MTKQNFFITASTITLVALMATASVAQSPGGAFGAGSATEQRQGNGGAAQGDTQSGPNASARAQENAAPSSAVQGQYNKSADGDGRGSRAADDKGKNRAAQRDTEAKPKASERAEERASPKSRVQAKEDGTPKASDRAEEKASPKSAVQSEKKADDESRRFRAADDKSNDAKKQQAERDKGKDRARSASDDATKDGRGERARREASDGDQKRRDRAEGGERGDRAADRVQLSEQKRKSVRERMAKRARANRVTDVDFDIRVGVNVPRTRTFYTLPQDVVEIVPEYRGYRYMYVRDEIVIVHPTNYVIVAVIGGDGRVGSRSGCRVTLASDDRVFVREHVDLGVGVRLDIGGLSLGMDLPNTVELRTLPDVIVERCPDLRDHRYFVQDENVVIVEPRTREVVLIIED